MLHRDVVLLLWTVCLSIGTQPAVMVAQWTTDLEVNTPVTISYSDEISYQMIPDGLGGAIVFWEDCGLVDCPRDLFAQRMTNTGYKQWPAGGIPICLDTLDQTFIYATLDGEGGFIAVWQDARGGEDLYAQKFNAAGGPLWQVNGIPVITYPINQQHPRIVSDDSGGAIIVWEDLRHGPNNHELYAQRVSASGELLWDTNGVPITLAPREQGWSSVSSHPVCRDGKGGAIIVWSDARTIKDIYAQRINGEGIVQWNTDGVIICDAADIQTGPDVVEDGHGGAFVTWMDRRNDHDYDIYAQRIDSTGTRLWSPLNGVLVMGDSTGEGNPTIITDDSGGVIITCHSHPIDNYYDYSINAQRVNGSGTIQWLTDGVRAISHSARSRTPATIGDGAGGVIITWEDLRRDSFDIYAQRIDALGNIRWLENGNPVSIAPRDQRWPIIAPDGNGGAIISWNDYRDGHYYPHVYAQWIDDNGYTGPAIPTLDSITDAPLDQGGRVAVSWSRPYLDREVGSGITHYTIFRRGPSPSGTGPLSAWEPVGDTLANASVAYVYYAPTLSDSTSAGTPYYRYYVSARTSDSAIFWDSEVDSGYSVDNVAPVAPMALDALLLPDSTVGIVWEPNANDPDVAGYRLYRWVESGFPPDPRIRIAALAETSFVDTGYIPGMVAFYCVTTVDIHGNESPTSSVDSVSMSTIAGYSLSERWNLVSVPVFVSDYAASSLYPGAVSDAYSFDGSYGTEDTLSSGVGYWIKYAQPDSVSMTGYLLMLDTITLQEGWNLIGSLGVTIPASSVITLPTTVEISGFWGYEGRSGYFRADTLHPGKAYWVKASATGQIVLSAFPLSSFQP